MWRRKHRTGEPPSWGPATNECGKYAHTSRKAARRHIRLLNEGGMRAYRCVACAL